MKILICDGLGKNGQNILKTNNIDFVIEHYELPELIKEIPQYDGMIVRSATKVPKEVIDAGTNLKLIARAGAGIDNIDHVYAKSINIPVLNTPGANSASAGELAIAHIFVLARFLNKSNISMRKGKWLKKEYKGFELDGKILGIIGFGAIGKIVAKKALGLGMKVIVNDIYDIKTDLDVKQVSLEEIYSEAEIITIHLPKLDKPLIGNSEIQKMKDGVYLINGARGGLIDEKALLENLNSGKVAGAGLDVWENEPNFNTELANHPNVSCTPHIGAATIQATDRVGIQIAEKIVKKLK
ncbi:MAG: D-2-hydroxyacid dehydrogenase [Candidatus Marinimicrobia bacterium]|nr:D-2-hydroxyacid dehydrogenase [Candidatus Neomarinimicrobiota bacterium]